MRRFIFAFVLAVLISTPAAGAFAQTVPRPAPEATTGCTPRRDHYSPAAIGIGATCSGMLERSAVAPLSGDLGDVWLFEGFQNGCVEVTLRSAGVGGSSPYLRVGPWVGTYSEPRLLPDGNNLSWPDTQVRLLLRRGGTYSILVGRSAANSYYPPTPYTLSLTQISC